MDSPTTTTQKPSSVSTTVPGFNHSHVIFSSLLSFPNSSPFSIASSFDRELDKALASASGDVSAQDSLLDRTLQLASLLLDSTKRCFRKRASAHNSSSWFLPPDLTIKVFSMLDTKSLMQASVCCTLFNKCAMDRLCYTHIDLTTAARKADSGVVCIMIHRAGKELRSLKLGRVARSDGSDPTPSLLNGSFLSPLSYNHGFLGSRLRSLRLYNIRPINYTSFTEVLSLCSNLTDLRITGLNCPVMLLFKTLREKCRLIENLCLEAYQASGTVDAKTGSPLIEFVTNSYNLTSLTLISFRLTDGLALNLAESSSKLKYLNLSRSPTLNGRFLRDLGHSCKESSLKTLIMRNCYNLQEKEVMELCNSLLKGKFKSIRHIDVSSNNELLTNGVRFYKPELPLKKLKEERSDVTFVADFPLRSGKCYRVCDEGDEEELREIEMIEAKNDGGNEDDSDDEESDDDDDEDDTSDGTGEDDDSEEEDMEF
ncbi:F-box protein SKIP17 isoform X2 [Brassica napus]|uniref:F-box protein SKIP17 isoform X2 n=1 Tax=Brassica napus TaxID=3708 RepID=UPI002079D422|nr:F-box protein SKIP17 isoform X2 [Brassica napus]